ncbi:MAG: outer membrane lipoprotein carrier protein LolA [Alphaproteobacteria bacterium]|nr:outer membrane lipoprotein carrier protein LolA [Alphaproteobacteria bacterium]MDA8004319.1 outer membrane lipoprotein carrier protein LolA [Alphaproteobacteria bacterium]MDA8006271.1 outer membrane lipoprotein carrier protein LolA [Alphaproteobacteria bacterium]MDA8013628.1 outer membrane lipoprotein carrier protein LolA [Alphaproteobacteria bacterium]
MSRSLSLTLSATAAVSLFLSVLLSLSLFVGEAKSATGNGEALARSDPVFATAVNWLRELDNMQGEFLQVSSNGAQDQGRIWMRRPNRMRIEYDSQPLVLLADGINWVVYDSEEDAKSEILLSATPFHFILQEDPDLSEINVTRVHRAAGILEVTFEDARHPEHGSMTLEFASAPFVLRGWVVLDAQGRRTRVSLVNPVWNADEARAPPFVLFRNDRLGPSAPDPDRR